MFQEGSALNKNSTDKLQKEHPSNEDVDQYLAKQLNNMSIVERELVSYDLHGISEKQTKEDDPGFLAERLAQLQAALDKKSPTDKQAYELALKINREYVTDRGFRLKFLRTDDYDPYNTALRLVRHFETKLDLFGEELLCKDITQDDLDEETLKCLYSGWIQDHSVRDVAGRVVNVAFTKLQDLDIAVKAKVRFLFYTTMVYSECEETQKKGRVFVVWISEESGDRLAAWSLCRLVSAIPVPVVAIHVCWQPEEMKLNGPLIALARLAVDIFTLVRMRIHTGSPLELKYILQTFGIPVSTMPISSDGEILVDDHCKRWARRRREERMRPDRNVGNKINTMASKDLNQVQVGTPGNNDVLLGRGRMCQDHVGSVRLRFLVDQHRENYDAGNKKEKTAIAGEIIKRVQELKGRFLKEGETGWVQVDELTARNKVSSCFRSCRKLDKRSEVRGKEKEKKEKAKDLGYTIAEEESMQPGKKKLLKIVS